MAHVIIKQTSKSMSSTENKIESNAGLVTQGLLEQAIKAGASDVHIDQERGYLIVRIRIDGMLYPVKGLEDYNPEEIISKIKVMAEMDIMEHRLPQDGHLELTYEAKKYNFRVSTTPTIYGEAVVMRMLNREEGVVKLENLGFTEAQLEVVTKMVNSPYGLILITGPTGSGKSTLMYSFLSYLNKPEKNIITLEDPVEYQMQNIRQMQINENIGWTFAKGMRAVVRQDPDVIMLGEIRDSESAQIALQAALAGKLVFSTFHTFDVPGIIIRLVEMGIPRSVIGHGLTGVIFTRLVRIVCKLCIYDYELSPQEKKILEDPNIKGNFKKGKGCGACHNSGYSGRVGIFEIVYFDDEIRANIMQEHPAISLHDLLKQKKTISMRESAIHRIKQGETTMEELVRVVGY